jgi:hypothetical protein
MIETEIPTRLTQEYLKTLLSYDPATGMFAWRARRGSIKAGASAGSICQGYINISIDGKLQKAHRLAWLYVNGEFPNGDIDHINGNRADNRIVNLRQVTRAQNMQNMDSKNGTCGTSYAKNISRWRAGIRKNGKRYHLGCFATQEEAHAAYLKAKQEMHEFQSIPRDHFVRKLNRALRAAFDAACRLADQLKVDGGEVDPSEFEYHRAQVLQMQGAATC